VFGIVVAGSWLPSCRKTCRRATRVERLVERHDDVLEQADALCPFVGEIVRSTGG